ncbi:hypothetical protein [Nocardiopsis sp. L17-MgMaSL7]|uniref:hypothetical protein n=1 Tax=Nocardiopsis sp. L17-MgMaSL7 TaxID=1938893 RepID=UPI000D7163AF|nr:hypothetical protein [Nocardiopsis sp. L17-MgMaSL7]PWV48494.1 hypothetical protein BDW27_11046 [Nocardiopsis sp. L17-MgMaSL7]
MSEEKTKVTLDYLKTLQTAHVDPLREKVSKMKTRASTHYPSGENATAPNVPFGNPDNHLPIAGELSKEVGAVLTQFTTLITDLEIRLVGMSAGIRNSANTYEELESDAELDATQVGQIITNGAPTGGGGGGGGGNGPTDTPNGTPESS